MKNDRYTKTVLTVIAICLLWISLRDFVSPVPVAAMQRREATPVTITGFTPDALAAISVFDPFGGGRRGVPVLVLNDLPVRFDEKTRK